MKVHTDHIHGEWIYRGGIAIRKHRQESGCGLHQVKIWAELQHSIKVIGLGRYCFLSVRMTSILRTFPMKTKPCTI